MRLPLVAQAEAPWLVQEIAADFTLDEVWEFPITGDASKGQTFRTFCEQQDLASAEPLTGLAGKLMSLRLLLGKLGLDQHINELPIPGCSETSVRDRLKPGDRYAGGQRQGLPFQIVYDLENERLLELSNGTVHALLHFSWAHKQGALHAPRMAVYIKPRGWFGRMYMGLIYPFRVLIVYPAIMRSAQRRWEKHRCIDAAAREACVASCARRTCATMKLSSQSLREGEPISDRNAMGIRGPEGPVPGPNSSPHLSWSDVPAGGRRSTTSERIAITSCCMRSTWRRCR